MRIIKCIMCAVVVSIVALMPIYSHAMLTLDDYRRIYPEYNDMTDYKLTVAIHEKYFNRTPFEKFAKEFNGPISENNVFTVFIISLTYSRQFFPQYNAMSDEELMNFWYKQRYQMMNFHDFRDKFYDGKVTMPKYKIDEYRNMVEILLN
ncbi:hypothetical protein [Desulfovibrio sp. QI0442]